MLSHGSVSESSCVMGARHCRLSCERVEAKIGGCDLISIKPEAADHNRPWEAAAIKIFPHSYAMLPPKVYPIPLHADTYPFLFARETPKLPLDTLQKQPSPNAQLGLSTRHARIPRATHSRSCTHTANQAPPAEPQKEKFRICTVQVQCFRQHSQVFHCSAARSRSSSNKKTKERKSYRFTECSSSRT